jgi:hypothetical protein
MNDISPPRRQGEPRAGRIRLSLISLLLITLILAPLAWVVTSAVVRRFTLRSPAFRAAANQWKRDLISDERPLLTSITISGDVEEVYLYTKRKDINELPLNGKKRLVRIARRGFTGLCSRWGVRPRHLHLYVYSRETNPKDISFGNVEQDITSNPDITFYDDPNSNHSDVWKTEK